MKKYIHRRNNLKAKYQRLRQKIERAIKNGRFYCYTKHKQDQLLKRLQGYYQRIVRTGQVVLPVAGLIIGAASVSQAQTFTLETTTASPFINLNVDPDTPFGLSNIGSNSVPTLVDIDGDGDLDAFIGDFYGMLNYFENTNSGAATSNPPVFNLSTSTAPFGLSDVGQGSRPSFVDIDRDGDLDAFIGEYDGNTNYFENIDPSTGTAKTIPTFVLSTDTAPFGLSDIGLKSTPTFVDIDGDGDLDAFLGEDEGNINYFENINSGIATSNNPIFILSTSSEPFGLLDVGSNSSPAFMDIDGDGDLDAFIGDFDGNINYFENTNSGAATSNSPVFSLSSSSEPFGLLDLGRNSSPTFVDIDGDGDLDAFIGEQQGNTNYFKNTNPGAATSDNPVFVFPVLEVYQHSSPTFVDMDGDGDLDAFVGERYGNINYFENTNSGAATSNSPVFSLLSTDGAFGLSDVGSYSIPTFVDIDGDGDLDAFVGELYGNINYFENTNSGAATSNSPVFSLLSTDGAFGLSNIGLNSAPTFVDIDGDGDLDAFVGERFGYINYFENTNSGAATSNSPVFSLLSTDGAFGLRDIERFSSPTFADIDFDGDLDAFVGEFDGNINYFENTSTNSSIPAFAAPISDTPFGLSDVGYNSIPTFVDIDNDGLFEAVVGNRDGRLNYFESDILVEKFRLVSTSGAFGLSNVGMNASPSFSDIDCDGDLDAFVGEMDGSINYFENTSTILSSPAFNLSSSTSPFGLLNGSLYANPTFVDIDRDGDTDAFIGDLNGINYFENTSTNSSIPAFSLSSSSTPFGLTDVGTFSYPSFVDIDGDGDLDAFIGELAGNINYFENTSTDSSIPAFTLSTSSAPFGLTDIGLSSSLTFVDIDRDGDLDAFIGEDAGNINYFQNTGTAISSPAFAPPITINPLGLSSVGQAATPTIVDIDGDGFFEAFIGNRLGDLAFFESNIRAAIATTFNCAVNDIVLTNAILKSGDYSTRKSIQSSSIIATSSTITFLATNSITLQQGFHARAGSSFTASIGSCSISSSSNESIENRTEELLEASSTQDNSQLSIFPNPVGDQLFIKNAVGQASILNMLGQVVQQFEIDRPIFSLDVSTLVSGQYILVVQQSNDAIVIQQFVK